LLMSSCGMGEKERSQGWLHSSLATWRIKWALLKGGTLGVEQIWRRGQLGMMKGELPPDIQVEMLCRQVTAGVWGQDWDLGWR
jgi:hypothetical protein